MQFFSRQDVQEAFGVLVGSEWKPKDQFVEFSDGLYERISPIYKVTHLSGELSTLLANSVYNAAAGKVIRDAIGGAMSEQYVGDDSLIIFDEKTSLKKGLELSSKIAESIYLKISPSKTTFFPFSIEKTQTHAKNGFYVPQDRIQILETERPIRRYGLNSEWFSFYSKMVTKSTRGFSFVLGAMLTSMYYHVGSWINGSKVFRNMFLSIEKGGLGLFYSSFKLPPPRLDMSTKKVIFSYPCWFQNNPNPREEKSLNVGVPKFFKDNFPSDDLDLFTRQIKQDMFMIFRIEGILKHRYNYRDFISKEKSFFVKKADYKERLELYPNREDYEGPFVGFSKDLYFVLNRMEKTDYIKALRGRDPVDALIGRDIKARCLLNASNFSKVKRLEDYFLDQTLVAKIRSVRDFSVEIENYGAFSNEFMAMFDYGFEMDQGILNKELVRLTRQIELAREHFRGKGETTS
uniref:RNA-directed RNA polymerase n=1 Tax=Crocidura shantungensis seadorna-like virus 5 TaxID=3139549 RepID=A0AB38ZKA1_9REOV